MAILESFINKALAYGFFQVSGKTMPIEPFCSVMTRMDNTQSSYGGVRFRIMENGSETYMDYKKSGFTFSCSATQIKNDEGIGYKGIYTITNLSGKDCVVIGAETQHYGTFFGDNYNSGSGSYTAGDITYFDEPITIPENGVGVVEYTVFMPKV